MTQRSELIAAAAMLSMAVAGCAKTMPPPVAFVDSPAFTGVKGRALGVLHGDKEAVVVERLDAGFTAVRYALAGGSTEAAPTWERSCAGPSIPGDDLGTFRWVAMESGRLVLLVASEANPDVVKQRVALFDPTDACVTRFQELLTLPVPGDVIAPGPVPAGATVVEGEPGVRLIDNPKLLRLEGPDGEVQVLLGVRERRVLGSAQVVALELHPRRFMEPRRVTVSWREPLAAARQDEIQQTVEGGAQGAPAPPAAAAPPTTPAAVAAPAAAAAAAPTPAPGPEATASAPAAASGPAPMVPLPELTDEAVITGFVLRPGQRGTWVIEGDGPLVMLEVWHGCFGQPLAPLELWLGRRAYNTGAVPGPDSFVTGMGRGHALEGGAWRDLFVLREAAAALELDVAKSDTPRCVREIRAFGFNPAPADTPAPAAESEPPPTT